MLRHFIDMITFTGELAGRDNQNTRVKQTFEKEWLSFAKRRGPIALPMTFTNHKEVSHTT